MERQAVFRAEEGDGADGEGRRRDEAHGGRAQGVEEALDLGVLPEGVHDLRHQQDDNKGRCGQPQGGDDAAGDPGGDVADVGGHVHPDGAGGGLGDGDHRGQIRRGEPGGALGEVKEEGNSGHAAAHGKHADEQKLPVETKEQDDHWGRSFRIFW